MRAIYCPSPKSGQIIRGTHAAINCGTRKKDSPFPRKRESRPKLAAKEIPAFAGMENVLLAFRPNLASRPKLIFWIPAYAGMTAWGAGENFAAKLAAAESVAGGIWRRRRKLRLAAEFSGGRRKLRQRAAEYLAADGGNCGVLNSPTRE